MNRSIKIGFLGNMNSMPMTYALLFKRDGFDVKYVVEADASNHLMRPEQQFSRSVSYPYPDWILEIPWENNLLNYGLLPYSNRAALEAMADRDVVFLNDYAIALASWLPKSTVKIALSSGGDIDQTCQWTIVPAQAKSAAPAHLRPLWWLLAWRRTRLQRVGLQRCAAVSYFPEGLNPDGDALLRALSPNPPWRLIPRYDVSFEAAGTSFSPTHDRLLREVLVGVRFKTLTTKGMEIEYKGNDIILRALARYCKRNTGLTIHLIRKGDPPDLEAARRLCAELGLETNVVWHDPMPLDRLFDLYRQCDVCFDQVGSHWMGAIGCYALHIGRPLIANARLDILEPFWGERAPILNATTSDQIVDHLVACEDPVHRARLGDAGHRFAAACLDADRTYRNLKDFVLTRCHPPVLAPLDNRSE